MKIYDISVPVNKDLTVWKGDPPVTISKVASVQNDGYNLHRLDISAHTGTHIDAPLHFIENGGNIGSIPLDALIGPVLVIEIPHETLKITDHILQSFDIPQSVERILFKTRNSKLWEKAPYFDESYTALVSSGAQYLVERKMKFVGMDYLSISTMDDLVEPHKILLSNRIVILESCNLQDVPAGMYQLICLPLKTNEIEGAPVRAILMADDTSL
jgi:arylformamidase